MSWFVIAEDGDIRETLNSVGIPAEFTQITHPRQIQGLAFPEEFADDVLRVLGEDPSETKFEQHPTNLDGFIFAIPRGPNTVLCDHAPFRNVLRRLARKHGLPVTFSSSGEVDFPKDGLLVFERPKGKKAGVAVFGSAFGVDFYGLVAEPGPVLLPLRAEHGPVLAQIDYRKVELLVKLSAARVNEGQVSGLLEAILEQAIPIARNPGTIKIVQARAEEERLRQEELRRREEEERLRREEEARRKAEEERRRLDEERRARLEAVGPEKRRIWIEQCRKRRNSDLSRYEKKAVELRRALETAAGRLIDVGWQIEEEETRIEVLDRAIASSSEEAGRVYDELVRNPIVEEIAPDAGGRFVIRTVPIPDGDSSACRWSIRFGGGAPAVSCDNGARREGEFPLSFEVMVALTKLVAERNFGAALELLKNSAEGGQEHA